MRIQNLLKKHEIQNKYKINAKMTVLKPSFFMLIVNDIKISLFSSKLKAQSSKLKAQSSKLKAQSSKLKAVVTESYRSSSFKL